jgi:gamma-glutamyltranspeptidase/glutathione hydrolase
MTNDSNDLSRRGFTTAALGSTLAAAASPAMAAQAPVIASNPEKIDSGVPQTMKPEIVGTFGIVAAGRHYAAEAAIRILLAGGNAFDAGAAAVFAASVTEISHFGFGGEAVVILYDAKSNAVKTISGQGTAPAAATPEYFAKAGYITGNGPNGGTLPAVMDSMALLLSNYGTMTLAQVMAPAIELADGFAMYAFLQGFLVSEREATEKWAWSKKAYYPDNRVVDVGEIFRQPYLAKTLRSICEAEARASGGRAKGIQAGRDAFYKGDIAKRIGAAVQADNGLMTYDDLANYKGHIEDPATTSFNGYDVYKCGFWNQGPTLLMGLNILEAANIKSMTPGTDAYVHTVVEAMKLAYADRNAYFGDPRFVSVPQQGLLSKAYAASRAKQIAATASLTHRYGDPYAFQKGPRPSHPRFTPHALKANAPKAADTTSIQIVDNKGNLFSCTPSSGWLDGGAYVAGDTGVPLSNRMAVFDIDPASPNVIAGGKRPRTTLTPSIIMKDGKPFLAIGTPGGDNQDQQLLQVMLNVLAYGQPLQAAIEAPRVNSLHFHESFALKQDYPGVLQIEDRFDPQVRAKLAARGHKLTLLGPFGVSSGVVSVGNDHKHKTLRGAADVRRERIAFGW